MSRKNQNRNLEDVESDSESYQEVETDPDLTNYNLEQGVNPSPSISIAQSANMVRRSPAKRTRIDKSAASTSHNATIFSDESSSDEEAPLPRPRGRPPLEKGGKQPYQSRQSRPVQKTGAARRKSTPRRREIRQLAEMRKLQMQTTSLIPKLPFARLVRYTLGKFGNGFRITQDALAALQESSELYLTGVLGDAFLITLSRRQVTLQPKDINLLMFLRGPASRLQ